MRQEKMTRRNSGSSPFTALRVAGTLAGSLATWLALAVLPAAAQSSPGAENRVVLRVNDRVATLYDYQRAVNEQIAGARNVPGLTEQERQERVADAGRFVMKALFEELLIMSRADQLAVVIDESEVEEQLRATRDRFGFENDEQFHQALAQQGMREEDFRAQIHKQLRGNVVRGREVATRVVVEDEDLRRFYRENEDRFRLPERARFEEVVVLEAVVPADRLVPLAALARTRMLAGGTAAEVAEGLGEGVTSVDVGWVTAGDLAPALDAVAWELEVDGVAEAIAARGGLHVLKMLERTPATVRPFEDVRDAIQQEERSRLFAEEYDLYLTELADAAYIVERLPAGAEGYRPVESPSLDADALGLLAPFAPGAQAREVDESSGAESSGEEAEETDGQP
jgi:parvulin-like peptidyl-prolyl isomerase